MKLKKILVRAFLVVFLVSSLLDKASAYQGDAFINTDPTTWRQRETPGAELPLGSERNGLTLGVHGCALHCISAMYIKYGARDKGYLPKDYREEALKINSKGGQGGISNGGMLMWGGASNQSNGYFEQPTKIKNPSKEVLFDLLKKNYGLVAEVLSKTGKGTHYVLLDSVDGNDIRIVDSGWGRTRLSEYPLGLSSVGDLWVYKPLKNADAKSLYESKETNSTSKPKEEDKNKGRESYQLSETELEGMSNLPKGISDMQDPNVEIFINFPSRDEQAKEKSRPIRESVERSNETKKINFIRLIISIVGWSCLLVGAFRLMVFVVDIKTSTNFYKFLNFKGKRAVNISFSESNSLRGESTITLREGLTSNILLIILGFFLLSGVFYSILLRIVV